MNTLSVSVNESYTIDSLATNDNSLVRLLLKNKNEQDHQIVNTE